MRLTPTFNFPQHIPTLYNTIPSFISYKYARVTCSPGSIEHFFNKPCSCFLPIVEVHCCRRSSDTTLCRHRDTVHLRRLRRVYVYDQVKTVYHANSWNCLRLSFILNRNSLNGIEPHVEDHCSSNTKLLYHRSRTLW